jgi:hypothetical protein
MCTIVHSAKVAKSFEPKLADKRKVLPGKSKKAIETNNRQRSLTSNKKKNHKKKIKEKKVIVIEDARKEEGLSGLVFICSHVGFMLPSHLLCYK